MVARELAQGVRTVCVNDEWLAIVPWWAAWPFETLLLPRRPWQRLDALDDAARDALATIVRELTVRYDNLFELLAEVQRDLTPEQAAAALRAVPALHYRAERASEPAP